MKQRTAIVLVVLALLLAACGGAGGTGPGASPPDGGGNGADSGATQPGGGDAGNSGSTATPPSGGWPVEHPVHPWNTDVDVGGLRAAVLNVTTPATAGSMPPTDGLQFVVVSVRFQNMRSDHTVTPLDWAIGYVDTAEVYHLQSLKFMEDPCWDVPNNPWADENIEIPPGAVRELDACIQVPPDKTVGGVIEIMWSVLGELDTAFFVGVP